MPFSSLLFSFVIAFLAASGCGAIGSSPVCECRSDSECRDGSYCDACICREKCSFPEDCPSHSPNCDQITGRCEAPCPEYACPENLPNCGGDGVCFAPCAESDDCTNEEMPNCGPDGLCFAPCAVHADCLHPDYPNCDPSSGICQGLCPETICPPLLPSCDPSTGICQGPCPDVQCPEGLVNCDARTGTCFGPCERSEDCPDPAEPNCDAATGLCQGRCPDVPCPEGFVNCGAGGLCLGPCVENSDCTGMETPNCGVDGICFGPCSMHEDCVHPDYPNCDPERGFCLPPCASDEDCPESLWKCDSLTGLCFLPECVDDDGCSPPETVCEEWFCVPGCLRHGDCPEGERCDLFTPEHTYHCEPRDCLSDADCTAPGEVCDTDGLADPEGGGYCVPRCESFYDCRSLGYDCDPAAGTCSPHDYGDVGADCAGGCRSGFCLAEEGNVCTNFCCIQHDCPAGWGCRPRDDGTGGGRAVDVCVPLDPSWGVRRYDDICSAGEDCRSGVCSGGRCRETCCTDEDCDAPFVSGMYCAASGIAGVTACFPEPGVDNDPLGTPGCMTAGTPGDCRSNLCFAFYDPDTGCTMDSECRESRPTCWDLFSDGVSDCVRDLCVEHCCDESDCPDRGSDIFACTKWIFGASDWSICLLHEGTALLQEGETCTRNGDCRSMVCSASEGMCRRRCCTSEDCTSPLFPRCALEENRAYSGTRLLNVCLP